MPGHRRAMADPGQRASKLALLRVAEMYAADAAAEREGKSGTFLMEQAEPDQILRMGLVRRGRQGLTRGWTEVPIPPLK